MVHDVKGLLVSTYRWSFREQRYLARGRSIVSYLDTILVHWKKWNWKKMEEEMMEMEESGRKGRGLKAPPLQNK